MNTEYPHRKLLLYYQRRLHILKEKQAIFGFNTPVEILLEIEDLEAKIEQSRIELEAGDGTSDLNVNVLPHQGIAAPLPSLIVGRENNFNDLRRLLDISRHQTAHLKQLVVVRGWPGVGKSTIASGLSYDTDIIKAFSDGVLWASLGQNPNLLSEVASWGCALGTDELLYVTSLEDATAKLSTLLYDRQMLLIIDDVWEVEHVSPFLVGGRRCATLITTRENHIAHKIAPTAEQVYDLRGLDMEKALELLAMLAPLVVAEHLEEATELVRDLEGLPLALQVAGRLLNTEASYGFNVRELLIELQRGTKLLESQAPPEFADLVSQTTPTVAALLEYSTNRLKSSTRDCYAYLGAFAPKPATFGLREMASIWKMDNPNSVIRELLDHGLLEYTPNGQRYQMHGLMVMYAKTLLTH